jgi:D-amino-acid dehydrogenase
MPVVRKLGVAAGALYKDLDKAGLRGGYESNGILNLFITESAYQDAIRDFEPLKVFDVKTEAVGREGVRERVPAALPGVVGGTYEPEESQCDPAAMTCELARLAGENGATILTQTEALDFTVASRRITSVYTTRGSFEPITVVLAAGIWSRSLAKRLRLNLPLQPAKGYSITIPRPEGVPEHLPLYLSEPHICVTPYGDELRLAGTLELSGLNYRVMENRVAGIRRGANEFLGGVKHSEPLRVWRGLRPLSPDGIPIIGLSPKQDNLVVATGHNMSGLMFGPITGKLVAQMLTGQQPAVDLEPFRVDRFSATLTL